MAMGQQKDRQGDLMVSWSEMPRSPGHVFYDRLQLVLIEGGFDGFSASPITRSPSVPPGRYFRSGGLLRGYPLSVGWSGASDSLSLREFLLLEMRERVPDHSCRTRARLPQVHAAVFDWVLDRRGGSGEGRAHRGGCLDWRPTSPSCGLPGDAGAHIETPTAEDLARLDRKPRAFGSRSRGQDRQDEGRTRPSTGDLDTGAVVAAELHPADEGDTTTLPKTLAAAEANLEAVDVAPTAEDPSVTDKGYHSRLVLSVDDGPWKSRISEPILRGTEMMRLAGRSPTTGPGCYGGGHSSCAPRSSSAPLPTTSIAAVCAGPGFGAARTCTSDTCFTSPATTYRC